jgi:plastocyanin
MKIKSSIIVIAALLLAACGPQAVTPAGTLPPIPVSTAPAALPGNAVVNISGFAFDPPSLTIKVGTTVTWTNQDSAVHNVKADDNSWGSNDLNKGDTYSFTFAQAGTYPYRCGFHANMKGTIIVVS